MSIGDTLGFAGLVLAFIGISIAILWADKRWIGWLCLVAAGLVGAWWYVEFERQRQPKPSQPAPQPKKVVALNPNDIKVRACWTELKLNEEVHASQQFDGPMDCNLQISNNSAVALKNALLHIHQAGTRLEFSTTPQPTDISEGYPIGAIAKEIHINPAIKPGSKPFMVTLHLPRTPSEGYSLQFEIVDELNQQIGTWGISIYRLQH